MQRRRKNKIVTITNDDGSWVEDDNQVHELFNMHYKSLFSMHDTSNDCIQTHYTFPILNSEDLEKLQMTVKEEEIKNIVFAMNLWKASGPMAFQLVSIRNLGIW